MDIQLKENILTPEEFIRLRVNTGAMEIPYPQAEKALKNGLFTVSAYHEEKLVGMGRLIGDGYMYWYIQDVAVLPDFQGKGVGRAIVERLIAHADSCLTGSGASIGLIARKDKEPFMKNSGNYSAGLCIYCTDRKKVIQECKNPIAAGDFHGFLHRNWSGTEQLQIRV